MIAAACGTPDDTGLIPQVLAAVDCQTRGFAQSGYEALTGAASPFHAVLTALLTIYVAVLGYRLLFGAGGARLADTPGIALKIGAILALVTSWSLFQTLVFDVVAEAPAGIARLIAAPQAGGLTEDPVAGLQFAHGQITAAAQAFGKVAGPMARSYTSGEAAAAQALGGAAAALFAASAGVTATATLAIGALTAIGPIFVALFLFRETRGLFVGWLRALLAAAFAPFAAWTLAVLMLAALERPLLDLARQMREARLETDTAMAVAAIVLVFVAAEAALIIAGAVISFSLRLDLRARTPAPAPPAPEAGGSGGDETWISRPERLAQALRAATQSPAPAPGRWTAVSAPGREAGSAALARRVDLRVDPYLPAGGQVRRPEPRPRRQTAS